MTNCDTVSELTAAAAAAVAVAEEFAEDIIMAIGVGDDESADEATVKRFYREDGRIRLQPENDFLEPIYARHVQVLGVVTGVFRNI